MSLSGLRSFPPFPLSPTGPAPTARGAFMDHPPDSSFFRPRSVFRFPLIMRFTPSRLAPLRFFPSARSGFRRGGLSPFVRRSPFAKETRSQKLSKFLPPPSLLVCGDLGSAVPARAFVQVPGFFPPPLAPYTCTGREESTCLPRSYFFLIYLPFFFNRNGVSRLTLRLQGVSLRILSPCDLLYCRVSVSYAHPAENPSSRPLRRPTLFF